MLTGCVWCCANFESFCLHVPGGGKKVAWENTFNNSANLLRAAHIALSWAMRALWLAGLAWRHGRAEQIMTWQQTCVCVCVEVSVEEASVCLSMQMYKVLITEWIMQIPLLWTNTGTNKHTQLHGGGQSYRMSRYMLPFPLTQTHTQTHKHAHTHRLQIDEKSTHNILITSQLNNNTKHTVVITLKVITLMHV